MESRGTLVLDFDSGDGWVVKSKQISLILYRKRVWIVMKKKKKKNWWEREEGSMAILSSV